jgi:phosphate/sulfate permease
MATLFSKLMPREGRFFDFFNAHALHGLCAEAGGGITLFLATGLGIPVSTTHTITGSIVGVGSAHSVSAVRWGVAGNIVLGWIDHTLFCRHCGHCMVGKFQPFPLSL